MKKTILMVMSAVLLCCLYASASVPENGHYGQETRTPWTCKAVLTGTDETIDEDWINPDVDDSSWETITGPIATDDTDLYHETECVNNTIYWIRRHFTVNEIEDVYRFAYYVDNECDVYLNGHRLLDLKAWVTEELNFTDEMISWLKVGDNVLAVRFYADSTTNGIDFGFLDISPTSTPLENNAVTERSLPIEFHAAENYGWYAEDNVIRSNNPLRYSESYLYSTVEIEYYTRLSFDYYVSRWHSEDNFKFYVDGQVYLDVTTSGESSVSIVLTPGKHQLEWVFSNGSYVNSEYRAQIANVELISNWATITTDTNGQVGKQAIYKFDRLDNPDLNFLKIVGPVGSAEQDDWNDIRNMKHLAGLDLSEARFDYLPDGAFQGMSKLSHVVLPEGITSIGNKAFYQTQLYAIDIPASVESIGDEAFRDTKLRTVRFGNDSKLQTIGYYAFCNSWLEYFDMPESVTRLGVYSSDNASTFRECRYLKRLKLSSKIANVYNRLCYNCTSLEEVILPSELEKMGEYTFYGTASLKHIQLPETLREIGSYAFHESGIESIAIPVKVNKMDSYTFSDCKSLKYIELPSYIESYYYNLRGCSDIETVVCKSPTPPVISYEPFAEAGNKANKTLYVPEFALADYKLDNYWQQFGTILPIDVTLDYWRISGRLDIPNDHRMGGKPDVDIYYGGKLTVTGSNPADYGYLQFYAGESKPGTLINRTEAFTTDSVNTVFPVDYGRWYFFTPLYDVKVSDIRHSDPTASMAIRYYNAKTRAEQGKGGWQDVTAETLHAGIGYILHTNKTGQIHFPSKAESRSAVFETEAKAIVLETNESKNPAHQNWNFVGNSYPCYFDIYSLDFTAPITVWDSSKRNFVAKSITDDEYALRPMEAFFVQKPDEIQNIVFAVSGRQHTSTVSPHYAPARRTTDASRAVFNISVEGNGMSDQTRVVLNNAKSLSYELDCDASKFTSLDAAVPQIFTVNDGTPMAINERPQLDGTVALGLTFGAKGEYTITATRADGEVTLYDRERGITTDLTSADYTISVDGACQMTDRFYLNVTATPTSITDIEDGAAADVAATDGAIAIKAAGKCSVAVYSITGIEVYAGELTAAETTIAVESGVYVVRINDVTCKVIVK